MMISDTVSDFFRTFTVPEIKTAQVNRITLGETGLNRIVFPVTSL